MKRKMELGVSTLLKNQLESNLFKTTTLVVVVTYYTYFHCTTTPQADQNETLRTTNLRCKRPRKILMAPPEYLLPRRFPRLTQINQRVRSRKRRRNAHTTSLDHSTQEKTKNLIPTT